MATLLRRSILSSWVPQAAGDSVRRPEPLAKEAAVKGRHVHGSGGRHQVATLLSLSPLTTLSRLHLVGTSHGSHDSQSSKCMECFSKRGPLSGPCTHSKMSVSSMPSAHCLARLSGKCAAGGVNHIRGSLLRWSLRIPQPRQHRESGFKWTTGGSREPAQRVYPDPRAQPMGMCVS